MSTKPDMLPGNDLYTTVTQISEQFNQRETIVKKRNPRLVKKKNSYFRWQHGQAVKGWKLSKDVNRKHKVYVRSFLLAKIKCMKDYIKHCIRKNNPDHVIIHSGTNKLERQAEIRAKFIIDVAKSIRTNTCTVSISRIVHTEWQL